MSDRVTPPELHARLAQVAVTTASVVIITDRNGVMVWVNQAFTRLTGYSFDEAIGRVPGQLLQGAETNRAEVARIGAALRARQSVAAELVNYAKDGRRYWVGMKIEPLRDADGAVDGFMAIQAEITQRHEELRALEQSTRRFNLATRAAHVGVFERDANFEFVWWSDMMWEIFGQSRATFKPSNEAWLALIHPHDRERIRVELAQLRQSPAAVNLHYMIVRPDGEIRHIESISAQSASQDGAVEHIGGIVLDVTERIQAEAREQELQFQLRESSHRAGMAEIVTGVLHNVGNVLNSLMTANTTARRDLKELRLDRLEQATAQLRTHRDSLAAFLTQDERGRHLPEYLPTLSAHIAANSRAIEAELERTEQLLHHLSDIVSAQQELARLGGQRESLRLNELVETALLLQAAELARIQVVREYEDLPPILTDRHKLLQIVVNLISNARDAVREASSADRRILVKLERDEDHAQLTIEDSGVGMSAEVLAQLWRFGFTTKKHGHGYGLHNCANAAVEIGATLTAHSDGPGLGSRFVLRLPIDPLPMVSGAAA
jgi:PAS domain S-box-containing protein